MTLQMALHNVSLFLNNFDANITKWFSEASAAMDKIDDVEDDGSSETAEEVRKIIKRFEKKNDDGTERHNTIMREMEDFNYDFKNFIESINLINNNKDDEVVINYGRMLRQHRHTYEDLLHDIKKDYNEWIDDAEEYMNKRYYQKYLGTRRVLGPISSIIDGIEKVVDKLKDYN